VWLWDVSPLARTDLRWIIDRMRTVPGLFRPPAQQASLSSGAFHAFLIRASGPRAARVPGAAE